MANTLSKPDKLCSETAIQTLFAPASGAKGVLAYPIRAVWMEPAEAHKRLSGHEIQFLVSIPKRRLKKAVDRVKMRRRIREAYRLHRHSSLPSPTPSLNLAFIYVGSTLEPYDKVETAMKRILGRICDEYSPSCS